MSGMTFLGTECLDKVCKFYKSRVGMSVWLEQADCTVLKHGNLLLGFCRRKEPDTSGIITFLYERKEDVDRIYEHVGAEVSETKPAVNEKYGIYHFFASDPEGRRIEFQCFLHPVSPYMDAAQALVSRRSIRHFQADEIHNSLLYDILESCRFSPTSRNAASTYFVAVRDRKKLEFLASLRGESSAPIARAPVAVAVCAQPQKSERWVQDGCIAAYHFTLAAWIHGLGTCWIAAMDRDDVKDALKIPKDHYVATVTPLGYPAQRPCPPARRSAEELLRFSN